MTVQFPHDGDCITAGEDLPRWGTQAAGLWLVVEDLEVERRRRVGLV